VRRSTNRGLRRGIEDQPISSSAMTSALFYRLTDTTACPDEVLWFGNPGRMILQDELDANESTIHEAVAGLYRQLVETFECSRNFDRAEDCKWGEMEMRRTNPDRLPFASRLNKIYARSPLARRLGARFTLLGFYDWASHYGSSYWGRPSTCYFSCSSFSPYSTRARMSGWFRLHLPPPRRQTYLGLSPPLRRASCIHWRFRPSNVRSGTRCRACTGA
jgi:hypothetical protein